MTDKKRRASLAKEAEIDARIAAYNLAYQVWGRAFDDLSGTPIAGSKPSLESLAAALRSDDPVPGWVRQRLADMIDPRCKRPKAGRFIFKQTSAKNLWIKAITRMRVASDVARLRQAGHSLANACIEAGEKHHISDRYAQEFWSRMNHAFPAIYGEHGNVDG